MEASYEFDPCSIDGSNLEENVESTLESWKPRNKERPAVPKSEWRQQQIDGNYHQEPGIDEIKKIKMYLKKKYPDYQIMDAFGITSETLVAIKRDCYDPIDGISLDNQSKIYKEFQRIEKILSNMMNGVEYLSKHALQNEIHRLEFKVIISGERERQIKKEKEDAAKKKKAETITKKKVKKEETGKTIEKPLKAD